MDKLGQILKAFDNLRARYPIFSLTPEYMDVADRVTEALDGSGLIRTKNTDIPKVRELIRKVVSEYLSDKPDYINVLYDDCKDYVKGKQLSRNIDHGLLELVERDRKANRLIRYYNGGIQQHPDRDTLERFRKHAEKVMAKEPVPLWESERYFLKLLAYEFMDNLKEGEYVL